MVGGPEVLHEIGSVMGLRNVPDQSEIMSIKAGVRRPGMAPAMSPAWRGSAGPPAAPPPDRATHTFRGFAARSSGINPPNVFG